jgi:hypothetical protein
MFSDTFSVRVEAKFLEKNQTRYFHQRYDLNRNRAVLIMETPNTDIMFYYMDYDNNNLLKVDTATSKCKGKSLKIIKISFCWMSWIDLVSPFCLSTNLVSLPSFSV